MGMVEEDSGSVPGMVEEDSGSAPGLLLDPFLSITWSNRDLAEEQK